MNIEFVSTFVSYSNCLIWPSHNSHLVRIWSRLENKVTYWYENVCVCVSFGKHAIDMTENASFKLGEQNPVPSHWSTTALWRSEGGPSCNPSDAGCSPSLGCHSLPCDFSAEWGDLCRQDKSNIAAGCRGRQPDSLTEQSVTEVCWGFVYVLLLGLGWSFLIGWVEVLVALFRILVLFHSFFLFQKFLFNCWHIRAVCITWYMQILVWTTF